MWGECVCGHHKAQHPWAPYHHGACRMCSFCDKPRSEHAFVGHQFQRCHCNQYREAA